MTPEEMRERIGSARYYVGNLHRRGTTPGNEACSFCGSLWPCGAFLMAEALLELAAAPAHDRWEEAKRPAREDADFVRKLAQGWLDLKASVFGWVAEELLGPTLVRSLNEHAAFHLARPAAPATTEEK